MLNSISLRQVDPTIEPEIIQNNYFDKSVQNSYPDFIKNNPRISANKTNNLPVAAPMSLSNKYIPPTLA